MIYCLSSEEEMSKYVSKNQSKVYFYSNKEFKNVNPEIKIIGSTYLRKNRKFRKNKNYLYFDGNYYNINDECNTINGVGYISVDDNKYIEYRKFNLIYPLTFLLFAIILIICLLIFSKPVDDLIAPMNIELKVEDKITDIQEFVKYPKEMVFTRENDSIGLFNDAKNTFYIKYGIYETVSDKKIYETGYIAPGSYINYCMYDYLTMHKDVNEIKIYAKGYTVEGNPLSESVSIIKVTIN